MAINFPNSPANNEIYYDSTSGNRYIYNGAEGVWKFYANTVGVSVSSTPPSNVGEGSMWWNRDTGRMFVYYNDGSSLQWVETTPAPGSIDSGLVASYANSAASAVYAVANAGFTVANGAFGKANTALQNTSGTFAGNMAITSSSGVAFSVNANTDYRAIQFSSSGTNGIGTVYQNSGVDLAWLGSAKWNYGGNLGDFSIVSNSALALGTSAVERMRITSGGSIGVGTISPQSQLSMVSNTSTAYVTTDNNYYAQPYPHELTIQNNQQNTTNTFCGIFFQAGQTSWQNGINAGRLSFVRDSNNSYGGNFTFSNRATASAAMREVMRIDQAGRVTMPYQPAFYAYGSSGGTVTGSAVMILNATLVNIGSHYSTSTGRFTAPIAGTYAFYISFNPAATGSAGYYRKNGTAVSIPVWSMHIDAQIPAIIYLTLAANDYVDFYYTQGMEYGLSHFAGHLIG